MSGAVVLDLKGGIGGAVGVSEFDPRVGHVYRSLRRLQVRAGGESLLLEVVQADRLRVGGGTTSAR